MKWALDKLPDNGPRHDVNFERSAFRLEHSLAGQFPRVERSVPASYGHVGFAYQPIVRYLPPDGQFPQVQFGPGILTVNQGGRAYAFESFLDLVLETIGRLLETRRDGIDDLVVVETSFALLNRFDVNEWDAFRQNVRPPSTKASAFIERELATELRTPFGDVLGEAPYRQSVSKTYPLQHADGRIELTVRDASLGRETQVVTFDQRAATSNLIGPLEPDFVERWLRGAHESTKAVFLSLRQRSSALDAYFKRTQTDSAR